VSACRTAGIERAVIVVLARLHEPLPVSDLRQIAIEDHGVLLTIIETCEHLIDEALTWSFRPLSLTLRDFSEAVLQRLIEIEADPVSPARWVELIRLGE
jgi:hypothetical protein